MTLHRALVKLELLDEFSRRATPETSSADLLAWLKEKLAGHEIEYPQNLRFLRKRFGHAAPPGGARPAGKNPGISVRNGNVHVHAR
jgi:hypothetical protein